MTSLIKWLEDHIERSQMFADDTKESLPHISVMHKQDVKIYKKVLVKVRTTRKKLGKSLEDQSYSTTQSLMLPLVLDKIIGEDLDERNRTSKLSQGHS